MFVECKKCKSHAKLYNKINQTMHTMGLTNTIKLCWKKKLFCNLFCFLVFKGFDQTSRIVANSDIIRWITNYNYWNTPIDQTLDILETCVLSSLQIGTLITNCTSNGYDCWISGRETTHPVVQKNTHYIFTLQLLYSSISLLYQ